jgi:hypothetical protein
LISAITTAPETVQTLREALAAAARDPRLAEARDTLRLEGFSILPLNDYRLISHLEDRAQALGYPTLQ